MLTLRSNGGNVRSMETAVSSKPILLRARLSADEWLQLRIISTTTRTPVADLVAAALRVAYPLTPKEDPPA